jgi:YgjP-like, metallopeptidase domain
MGARVDQRQRALFAPSEIAPAPTGIARLRALAADAPALLSRPRSPTEEDGAALERLRGMAVQLAATFGLRYASIEAEVEGVVEHYGICYADGRIRVRLRHAATGRLLKESSLVDTVCHELAHLKHFDHSIRFRRFHGRILDEARRRGWYTPGPAQQPPPPCRLFEPPKRGEPHDEP